MGGLATVITMILLPIIPESMFGYMYLGLMVPGLVGAIVIMWLFVGETRGLDLKTYCFKFGNDFAHITEKRIVIILRTIGVDVLDTSQRMSEDKRIVVA